MRRFFAASAPHLLLFALVFALFSPSIAYRFVDFDDPAYLIDNPVRAANSPTAAFRKAFSSFDQGMYAPILWYSYALDEALSRPLPTVFHAFHLTNVLLHAVNAVLFALLLSRFCRKRFLIFFCAALWALHPLRVESVAWLAERKDVLSAFFALLSMLAWLRFLRPAPGRSVLRAVRYGLALLLFAAALLVKVSVAPLPAALLLLDVWPLRRFRPDSPPAALRSAAALLAEKVPFFALSLSAAALASLAHRGMEALQPTPLAARLASVPVHAAFYLFKTIFPRHLAPAHPDLPLSLPLVIAAALLLAFLAFAAFRLRRHAPAVPLGFLLFAVFLFPASGIVRFGMQSVADRFTYLPALGLSVALAALPIPAFPRHRRLDAALALTLLAACSAATLRLLPVWRNADSLNDRVLLCNPTQGFALAAKASRLLENGDPAAALSCASLACRQPGFLSQAHVVLAIALQELGRPGDALDALRALPPGAVQAWQRYPIDWEIARAAFALGRCDEAFDATLLAMRELPPREAPLRMPYLHLLAMAAAHCAGRPEDALAHARAFPAFAAKTSVSDADLLPFHLFEWMDGHRLASAPYFRDLLAAHPHPALANNLLWGFATSARSPIPPDEILAGAIRLADSLPSPNAAVLDTVAAAQARSGFFREAVDTATRARLLLAAAPPSEDRDLSIAQIARRIELYRSGRPYSEDAFSRWLASSYGQGLVLDTLHAATD